MRASRVRAGLPHGKRFGRCAAWANAAWEMRPGGFPAKIAQFRFPRPSYAWRLDKLCGVRPVFDAPLNAVLLPAKDLDAPLPQANATMARLCEEQCRQLLAKRQVRSGVSGQIRDRLLRNPADMPSLDDVAAELHTSVRSLRRRLDDERTSFRALVDEVRQTLAEEMLTAGHMKLAEIAARLGYTEPAAFIAAFKRWKGVSPTAYRASRPDSLSPRHGGELRVEQHRFGQAPVSGGRRCGGAPIPNMSARSG